MSMDLILIHVIFIAIMSTVSYLWGEYAGKELGRKETEVVNETHNDNSVIPHFWW